MTSEEDSYTLRLLAADERMRKRDSKTSQRSQVLTVNGENNNYSEFPYCSSVYTHNNILLESHVFTSRSLHRVHGVCSTRLTKQLIIKI